MEEENREIPINPRLAEILKQLTKDQLRFIVALQEYPTKDAAAKAIRVKPATVYEWPDVVDEAAQLLAADALEAARALRRRNLVKAMGVKAAGLNSKDERIRQVTATEIIEWELGKAKQSVDLSNDGKPFDSKAEDAERHNRAILALADAIRESIPGTGAKSDGEVDTAEQTPMVGPTQPGG